MKLLLHADVVPPSFHGRHPQTRGEPPSPWQGAYLPGNSNPVDRWCRVNEGYLKGALRWRLSQALYLFRF